MRYAILFVVIPKFRITKEKEKKEDTVKRPETSFFFFPIKALLFEL